MASTQVINAEFSNGKASFNLPTITSTTTVTALHTDNMSVGVTTISDAMTIGATITTAVDTVSFSAIPTATKSGGNRCECSLLLMVLGVIVFAGGSFA